MQKKILSIVVLTIMLLISFSGCQKQESTDNTASTNLEENEIIDTPIKPLTLDEFIEKINGTWVDMENCRESYDGVAFNAWTFDDGTMYWAAYPGGGNQPGEITQVIDEGNNIYKITVHYPGGEWMGDYENAKDIDFIITFDDDTIKFDDENVVYKFMGKSFEKAHNKLLNTYSRPDTIDAPIKPLTLDEFIKKINGIWVDMENCRESYDGIAFNAWYFENGTMYWAAYPGGGNQPGEITQVIDEGNNIYKITVHYPGGEWMGDYEEAKDIDFTITFDDDTIKFDNENIVWKFMGKSFEEVQINLNNKY